MKRNFASPSLVHLLLLALLGGCGTGPATTQSSLPTVSMKIGARTFTLEVAADEYSRERGLMERDSMPADHGMIFVFPSDSSEGFWMKNTHIPLDILFIDAGGKVVSVHTMKPFDMNTTSSDGEYRYAIELNAGAAADVGVKAGDHVDIPRNVGAASH
ncbi:MAG TPA: DUF192 domain-containing protein [Tepidisphaeraceae bacterium]|nr:DUF192 domain-containing protein [Tepidisphaeraceae bacterium]